MDVGWGRISVFYVAREPDVACETRVGAARPASAIRDYPQVTGYLQAHSQRGPVPSSHQYLGSLTSF